MKKTQKEIDDIVCEVLNDFAIKFLLKINYYYNFRLRTIIRANSGYDITELQLRKSIENLRNSGRLRLFIGNTTKGYKFATTTEEIQLYMKRLHARAMKFHKLYAVEKEQAAHDLGCQIDIAG